MTKYHDGDEKVEEKDIVLTGFYNARLNSRQELQLNHNLPSEQTVKDSYEGNAYTKGGEAWYIYNRSAQLGKIISSNWGRADEWVTKAQQEGYAIGNVAEVEAIAYFEDVNKNGHLAFVEYVNSDGSFIVSEMPSPKILNWRLIQPQSSITFIYL
ncbi:CHAP domain-containing protein [Streptococcus orisasini]